MASGTLVEAKTATKNISIRNTSNRHCSQSRAPAGGAN
jgi:hypothetical protein